MWPTIHQIHDSYKARVYFYTQIFVYVEQNSSLEASVAIQLLSFPIDVREGRKEHVTA